MICSVVCEAKKADLFVNDVLGRFCTWLSSAGRVGNAAAKDWRLVRILMLSPLARLSPVVTTPIHDV